MAAVNTQQLYTIVNAVNKQTMGESAIEVVDTNSFIAMGNAIIDQDKVSPYLNTLAMRIGKTIISSRAYTSQFRDYNFTDMQWGALMQKIYTEMPDAVADDTIPLTDGQSVDMYIVKKPKAKQKFFVVRSPLSFFQTYQRKWLREAFLSESAMGAFIGSITQAVQNKIQLSQENLARATINNFIVNLADTQKIHLITEYAAATGTTVTATNCLYDEAFIRFCIGRIKEVSMDMTAMSVLYNKDGYARHTPRNLQRAVFLTEFQVHAETQVEWAAFNAGALSINLGTQVPYWQTQTDRRKIMATDEDGEEVTMSNVIGLIHDRDALGTFRKYEDVLTTPINARGDYYNTFWHFNDARFNDMSENGIVFLLD